MAELTNKRWIFTQRPQGPNTSDCFRYETPAVPTLQDGEYLIKNLFLAMDPAVRTWMNEGPNYRDPLEIGKVMEGTAVGEIIASKHDSFKPGDIVMGMHGWELFTIGKDGFFASQVLPSVQGVPPNFFLGVLGPTGLTAYFSMLDKLHPQAGETILISAAAGAVGSVAGQICKIKGAKVVGLAGSDEKCAWLENSCGFDATVNYRTAASTLSDAILEAAPQGIDAYFDNVGGNMFDAALDAMNDHGRVTLCGFIAGYDDPEGNPAPPVKNLWQFLLKRMTMNAFLLTEYTERFPEAFQDLVPWVLSGKIHHREHIVEGLENAPEAFRMLFDGRNQGKLLLKV